MRPISSKQLEFHAVLVAFLAFLPIRGGMAQIQEQSALGAIKFLTQPQFADFLDGCGPVNKYRAAAAALAKLGDAALPAINAALESVEELGEPSKFAYNAELLLLDDAGIRGPVAYSRLARMIE